MISGTVEGIVIQKTDYSDTSVIVRLLTEDSGVKSFIFPGGKSKKKGGNLLMPLAIVSVTYTQKPNHELGNIKEISPTLILKEIPFNPIKSGILFFMNEVVIQTVKEQEDNERLYQFLKSSVEILDLTNNYKNFAVVFLIQLTNYLGVYPKITPGAKYFDLRESTFISHTPAHPAYVSAETSKVILDLMQTKLDGSNSPQISLQQRRSALHEMLNYYRVIFDQFKDLHSLAVLETTFHD
ncbi:MAG: DNA repair protein RecO [Crocinitomicaceae bacterium]|nr:DNA repair protein RecO [Crocinitomicaceae bacterium]